MVKWRHVSATHSCSPFSLRAKVVPAATVTHVALLEAVEATIEVKPLGWGRDEMVKMIVAEKNFIPTISLQYASLQGNQIKRVMIWLLVSHLSQTWPIALCSNSNHSDGMLKAYLNIGMKRNQI